MTSKNERKKITEIEDVIRKNEINITRKKNELAKKEWFYDFVYGLELMQR